MPGLVIFVIFMFWNYFLFIFLTGIRNVVVVVIVVAVVTAAAAAVKIADVVMAYLSTNHICLGQNTNI